MFIDKIKQLFTGNKSSSTSTSSTGHTGIVKYFSFRKGFGFIIDDVSKKDIYVHHSGLIDKVRKGDKVEFKLDKNDQGMIAIEVRRQPNTKPK